ncbi:hypothetical protein HPB48_006212 [Haemaphysalis longicornis]|uniref:Uncharacterized protein n=1 Tax=Haemaphysalis longicornis TaxID=44386 RepID=A0A9J6FVG2_HAELO|nr:hypothetical protein HPB48_006212 [Haemaphysalis longicornis]
MQHLVNITRHYLGQDTILFRSDGPHERRYRCDNVSGTLATANFRSLDSAKKMLGIVRRVDGAGTLLLLQNTSLAGLTTGTVPMTIPLDLKF